MHEGSRTVFTQIELKCSRDSDVRENWAYPGLSRGRELGRLHHHKHYLWSLNLPNDESARESPDSI